MIARGTVIVGLISSLTCVAIGCDAGGSYALRWTLGCDGPTEAPCELDSVRDCRSVGIDLIEVVAESENARERTRFSCYSAADGATGQGPNLPAGTYQLSVIARSAAGRQLTEPTVAEVVIESGRTAETTVDLPIPPACNNGVDDDGDQLVDAFDPQCGDAEDVDESR